MSDDVARLREQLAQLTDQHARGSVDEAAYAERRAALERRIVDAVMASQGGVAPAGAAPAAAPAPGANRGLWIGLAALIVVIAGVGYWMTGSPGATGMAGPGMAAGGGGGGPGAGEGGPEGSPHAVTAEQIQAMVDKLAARLKEQPDDPDGWAMLARSYSVTQRHAEAVQAYERAVALRKDDAVLLADFADTLAMVQGRSLEGKPMALVTEALRLDPGNLKALSLAGTAAFNRKDYAGAVRYWEMLSQVAPPDNVFVRQIASGIEEARSLMGSQGQAQGSGAAAAAPATAPGGDTATAPTAAAAAASVRGTVRLAPALAQQAAPEDTVFIFARGPAGGVPLAILRKQVKDLPFDFVLDDSLAMSPAARLSGVQQVMVSARVSRSGNAMPQPGDLQGAVGPVPVGATGLVIEIAEQRP